jgi:S-adenosyl methyltransferase
VPGKFFRSSLPNQPRETPMIDASVAHIARIYDYWLDGKDNFAVDREVGEKVLAIPPPRSPPAPVCRQRPSAAPRPRAPFLSTRFIRIYLPRSN